MLDLGSMRTESASKMRRTGGGTCHEEKEAEEEKGVSDPGAAVANPPATPLKGCRHWYNGPLARGALSVIQSIRAS